jgi:uncharacterized protein (TIGR02246 family)
MKYLFVVLVLGLTAPVMAQSADVDAIKQLNEDWIANYVKKDKTTFDRIFAEDFVLINPAGKKMTKQEILAQPAQPISEAHVEFAEVQIHGPIGLIHAKCSFTMLVDGKESKGSTDYLDVYEKRNGRWWAIAAHVIYLGN